MSEWQLIETAPHGLDVLMGWVECHSKEWKCEVGQASYGWSINGISNMSRHGSATHWMPLPQPPSFESAPVPWNEIRSAVTQQFEKTLEYLGKTGRDEGI